MEKLRFAPIIRVSTDKQRDKGESLNTQTGQIKQYVEFLKGTIPKHCWKYAGQEHATPDNERLLLNQLLSDVPQNLFDAVIVCDASRWSRDNQKSKEGLKVLRDNGIRFFVGTTEYDLFNPEHTFFLGVSAELGELQARQQALKSITNRINRARKGIPSAGKLPYGRYYDKAKGEWGVDKEKKALIEMAARRYLAGEQVIKIAATLGMNASNLHKLITKRSGTEWDCTFESKALNISETVTITIPPLLDEKTIKEIQERTQSNKTYVRGNRVYDHLLQGVVYCSHCGYKMTTYRNARGKNYYRHSKYGECKFRRMIPGNDLENLILLNLIKTFGDTEKIETAVKRTLPNSNEREVKIKELKLLEDEKRKLESELEKLIDAVAQGIFTQDDIRKRKGKNDIALSEIRFRINTLSNEIDHIPDPKKINRAAKLAVRVISDATRNSPKLIFKRDYKWKRNLVEKAFAGANQAGAKIGVYVGQGKEEKGFSVEIRGLFFNTVGNLPLADEQIIEAFNLDPLYQDVEKELESIKLNMYCKRYAYNCKCLY